METLQKEWGVVSAAPFSFLIAVSAVTVAIWAVLHFLYGQQIKNLKEDRDYYKGRSERDGGSVRAAGRALTEKQKASLLSNLAVRPSEIRVSFTQGDEEALSFAKEIVDVFNRANWRVVSFDAMITGMPKRGMELCSRESTPYFEDVLRAFRSEGIDVQTKFEDGYGERILLVVWKQPRTTSASS